MKIFNSPFLAGLLYGILLLSIQWLSSLNGQPLNIGKIGTISFLTLFPCALVLLYYQQLQLNRAKASLGLLIFSGFKFILGAALVFGLAHFINASYLDPEWGQKALAQAQEDWAARGYSEEAISGQIEWSDTYQNPAKWSLVIFGFYCLTYGIIHFVLSIISFSVWQWWQRQKTRG